MEKEPGTNASLSDIIKQWNAMKFDRNNFLVEKKQETDPILSDVIKQKEDLAGKLISFLETTDDIDSANDAVLVLVNHFRDDRIEPCLMKLIQEPRWKHQNETFLYALKCYTNDPDYLYFLIDLLFKYEKSGEGEIFMDVFGMILNLHPPLDSQEITRALRRVRREAKKKGSNEAYHRRLVDTLLRYLEEQREIEKFYWPFHSVLIHLWEE
ncbi:MAG: hypothetical protein LBL07_19895 [Tannerella sp.]|jgi:hypothetical protein|nr:hypothetical protein [Tannerella sp.]